MKLSKSLDENINSLKQRLTSDDITFLDVKINKIDGVLIFVNDLVNKESLGKLVLEPLSNYTKNPDENELFQMFLSPEKVQIHEKEQLIKDLLVGNAILLADGLNVAISFGLKYFEQRAITEPPTSTVIKGPREGFVENLSVNISMMRRKLKTPDLVFENLTLGEYSSTPIAICYIKGIAQNKLVKQVKKRLNSIKIDGVLDSSYVSKFLNEHSFSLFKQVGNTEKPDILAGKILEGRIAIFVDGSPIALTVPYLLIEDFQSASDYYSSSYSATMSRYIRIISVALALFLPALYVSAELFHLQLIPLSFLLTIVNSIKGIPLSPSFEMFFTLLIFEILNEASVRMPKYVGMVVSIVGGLVLGETAVNAGIISAPTLMIVALSGICLYTVPELEQTFSVLRLVFLLIAGTLGVYGIILIVALLLLYLVSFESYSTPLCAPFSPLIIEDMKDAMYKGFIQELEFRPKSLKNKNKRRIKKEV